MWEKTQFFGMWHIHFLVYLNTLNSAKIKTPKLTCGVGGHEALPLYRRIALEHHEHLIASGENGVRDLGATEPAENVRVGGVTVVEDDVVVRALLVWLHLKLCE